MRLKQLATLGAFAAVAFTSISAQAVKMQNVRFYEIQGPMAPWGQGNFVPLSKDLSACEPGTHVRYPVVAIGQAYNRYGTLIHTEVAYPYEGTYEWQVPSSSRGHKVSLVDAADQQYRYCSSNRSPLSSWKYSVMCFDWDYYRVGSSSNCSKRAFQVRSTAWSE